MHDLSPREVLQQVAEAVPAEYREHIIVIGSLAVGYHFFRDDDERAVRTKDIDCLLSPRDHAQVSGQAMTEALVEQGWRHRKEGEFGDPQPSPTPADKLSAIRLFPPESQNWFLELLTTPESETDTGKSWLSVMVHGGYYGLPRFGFLSLTTFEPYDTPLGIRYARPSMMALANLLEHPRVTPDTMCAPFDGRMIKRANKDLGRVLTIARLSDPDEVETWLDAWGKALPVRFPNSPSPSVPQITSMASRTPSLSLSEST